LSGSILAGHLQNGADQRRPRVDGFVIYEANIAGIPSYAYFWRGGKVARLGNVQLMIGVFFGSGAMSGTS